MAEERLKVDVYMPLYVSDYDRDTADLSFEEHGFYGALLRALWTRDGELDGSDRPRLARILRTDRETFDRLWPAVERFFTIELSGKFQQKRLTRELDKAIRSVTQTRENAAAAGRASAAARAKTTGNPTSVQPALEPASNGGSNGGSTSGSTISDLRDQISEIRSQDQPSEGKEELSAVPDPLHVAGLILLVKIAVGARRPELGLYHPGRWAARAAESFLESIPPDKRTDATRDEIRAKISAFAACEDQWITNGKWSVEAFLNAYNQLAVVSPKVTPKPTAALAGYRRLVADVKEQERLTQERLRREQDPPTTETPA